jgi:hypothetical protein
MALLNTAAARSVSCSSLGRLLHMFEYYFLLILFYHSSMDVRTSLSLRLHSGGGPGSVG